MLKFTKGNMFEVAADIRVNTVNCVGVMGAGVALAFKERYPEMYRDYKRQCELRLVRPGKLHVWKTLSGDWIINFPTKRHWREKSRYEDIESGLVALREYLEPLRQVRVTLPALGSGHGRLDWTRVSAMIRDHLEGLEAEIIVFDPIDSRTINGLETSSSMVPTKALLKGAPDFPAGLTNSEWDKIYYEGDLGIFHGTNVTIALSAKPTEREKEAAIDSIGELPKSGVTVSLVLGTAAATKLAETALDRGMRVAAWVPQGLSRYRLPKTLGCRHKDLLLLSLANPQQAWNPSLARQTNLASLVASQATLVTDPDPDWANYVEQGGGEKPDTHFFYLRYQALENRLRTRFESLSAKPIGRRSSDGKPNLTPILDALGMIASHEPVQDLPPGESAEEATVLKVSQGNQPEDKHSFQPAFQPPALSTRYPKRLIEVDLPIKRISAHARREKSIRHGHISTLHIWWARRPLAACRAVICASLWFDPADPLCPPDFREEARMLMREWVEDHRSLLGAESFEHFEEVRKKPSSLNDDEVLRTLLLDFIADFANWDNSTNSQFLETSRALTHAAHLANGGEPGTRPLVVDFFAGGGSIPLEALRVGADAFASDLNPVAVLLNKVVLEYIPKYGQRLADEVRKWGNQIQDEVEAELAKYYPTSVEGDVPVAYLWARTVISEAPSNNAVPVEVPLLRSMWLAKASSQDRAFRWKRDSTGDIATEMAEVSYADGTKRTVRRPLLEIFAPTKSAEVEPGTVARGSATCPITGFTTPVSSIRKQLKPRAGGTSDARLLAIRQSNPKTNDRSYRAPTLNDQTAADTAKREVEAKATATDGKRPLLPNEPLPPAGGLGFRVQPYGMVQWKHLFAPRQQLALITLTQSINRVGVQLAQTGDRQFAVAVQSCLALALGRLTDFCSSLCTLNTTGNRGVKNTFTRQALSMVWDFMETAPLNRVGANWIGGIDALDDTIRFQAAIGHSGQVQMASAANHPLPDDIASAIITDPPYYDAVPYSDLSDYFYVWLKRTLPSGHGFDSELTPKAEECILDEAKGKDRAFFESQMAKAMGESRRFLRPDGISVVVFAHKSTSGWEAQLQAMVDAGWTITGSWPIDTERPGRLRAQGSAALQSSVHLVCRPRENPDGSMRTDEIGDWRDVLHELPRRIHEWMPRLAEEGVVGADAIFACLGPALEIFSRYSRVEKASGEKVELKEYLEQVWAAVANEALTRVFHGADATGFEEDARLTAMWLWTLFAGATNGNQSGSELEDEGAEERDDEQTSAKGGKPSGFVLEYDAARKIAQGLGARLEALSSLVEVKGDKARLLPVGERTKYLFGKDEAESPTKRRKKEPQGKLFELVAEAESEAGGWGSKSAPKLGDTVLDRIHQSMILFAAGRGEALKRFLVDDGAGSDERFWRLAQALVALYPKGTDERRWIEGVTSRKKGLGF